LRSQYCINLTGLSDTDSEALVLRGFIGSTAPSTSTAAIELRAGKSDGSTGIADLASTELALAVTDSTGTVQILNVFGNGDTNVNGVVRAGALSSGVNAYDIGSIGTGTIGVAFSSGSVVHGFGVSVSETTDNAYVSSLGALVSRSAMKLAGNEITLMTATATTTAIGSPVTLSEVIKIAGTEVFLNLPLSAGTTGSLYSNSGVVTVAP